MVALVGFTAAVEQRFVRRVRDLVGNEMQIHAARITPQDIHRGPTGKVFLVISALARGQATRP